MGKGEAAVSGRRASSSAIRVDYAVIIRAAATLRNKAGIWFAEEFPRGSRKRSPQGGNRLSLRPTISPAYCCGFGGAPSMRLSRVGLSNSIPPHWSVSRLDVRVSALRHLPAAACRLDRRPLAGNSTRCQRASMNPAERFTFRASPAFVVFWLAIGRRPEAWSQRRQYRRSDSGCPAESSRPLGVR